MSAIWYESGVPSFMGPPVVLGFHQLPEIHAIAPAAYEVARFEMNAREIAMGDAYYRHIADLAHGFYMRKRDWWDF